MTIQEAIKSGKPFTRKSWHSFDDNFYEAFFMVETGELYSYRDGEKRHYDKADILADDWEIKQ